MKPDSSTPLAYFITLRSYGTWLHGDARLSVSRTQNQYGAPKIKQNMRFEKMMQDELKHQPVNFNEMQREIIKEAITDACNKHDWRLHALHVRTNHIHLVITANNTAEVIVTTLKTKATTLLRKQNATSSNFKIWSRHASTKYVWTECSLHYVCSYTLFEQGEMMSYVDNFYGITPQSPTASSPSASVSEVLNRITPQSATALLPSASVTEVSNK